MSDNDDAWYELQEQISIDESLEDAESGDASEGEDDADSENDPDSEEGLVAGQAVSLEEVLDTIFNILYTHSAQISAIGEHLFGAREEAPIPPTLTIVGDVD